MTAALPREVFVEKGYLLKSLALYFWQHSLYFIPGICRNTNNCLISHIDKILLRKRLAAEILTDKLKSSMGLERARHRFLINALVHVLACLIAYSLPQPRVKTGVSLSPIL